MASQEHRIFVEHIRQRFSTRWNIIITNSSTGNLSAIPISHVIMTISQIAS
jgi:hypothetical protein